jgi:hypothetical protein
MIWKPLWNHWWRNGNGKSPSSGSSMPRPPGDHYVLVLEGTGFLQPEAVRKDVSTEEQAQALIEASGGGKAFRGLRKWFFYKHEKRSRFYQTVQVLFTNEYLIEARANPSVERYVCFAVCKPQGNSTEPTVGVEFDHFVLGRTDNVILWSEPAITEWPLPAAGTRSQSKTTLIESLKKALGTPTSGSNGGEGYFDLEWFIKASMLSEERVAGLVRACKESRIVCGLVSCSLETITTELSAYRLCLRCKVTSSAALKAALKQQIAQAAAEAAATEDDEEDDDDF